MMSLIETIMHLSKIEENQTTITWKPVDMGKAARYAADLIEPQAAAKHVTIHVDAEPLYVYGNSSLLSELVMNCVDNAVKYNREGGTVTVSVRPEGEDKVRLAVSDTGIGIPKEKQGRVFERFYWRTRAATNPPAAADWDWPSASTSSISTAAPSRSAASKGKAPPFRPFCPA